MTYRIFFYLKDYGEIRGGGVPLNEPLEQNSSIMIPSVGDFIAPWPSQHVFRVVSRYFLYSVSSCEVMITVEKPSSGDEFAVVPSS